MRTSIVIAAFLALSVAGYYFWQSDNGLLSENYAMKAATNVLGDPLYEKTCLREHYVDNVGVLEGKFSFVFSFKPKPNDVNNCPEVSVIIDRKTGEAWVKAQ